MSLRSSLEPEGHQGRYIRAGFDIGMAEAKLGGVVSSNEASVDYVIVGGGSAGCVLARRLSEDPSVRVLLLEAGSRDRGPLFRIPIGTLRIGSKFDWQYPGEPDASRHSRVARWGAGKVLGGGSSINAMTWTRGNPLDFDNWAAEGATGWSYADVLPFFKKAETFDQGANTWRGGDGPQHVSRLRVDHPMTERFLHAAVEVGFDLLEDLNGERQDGVSKGQFSQERGIRDSTSRAYLRGARRRRNLIVHTHAVAHRVVFDGTRAIGVEYRSKRGLESVLARREVILAAGALASPKLLMVSGVGPREGLERHGITLVAESPAVGKNLQEHAYAGSMFYGVTEPTLNRDARSPWRIIKHALNFLLFRRGPVTSGFSHAMVFALTDPQLNVPQTEIIFAPFGVVGRARPASDGLDAEVIEHDSHDMQLFPVNTVTVAPAMLHPKGRGEVRLRSSDPEDPPLIDHELLGHPDDVRALIRSCRLVREIFGTSVLKPVVVNEILPGDDVNTDEEWESYLRRAAHGGYHTVGTCKMGIGSDTVVDPELRVRGVDGLRVVDASVIPTLPSGHTNAAVIMIAEKAADLIKLAHT